MTAWLLALVLAAAAQVGEPVAPALPEPAALPPAQGVERVMLPAVTVAPLPGGASLWEVPRAEAPLVVLEMVLTLPPDQLAPSTRAALGLLPTAVDAGSAGAPRGGLDAQLEPLGASVMLSALDSGLRLRLQAPPAQLDQALAIVAGALQAPGFPRRATAQARDDAAQRYERIRGSATGRMRRAEEEVLYPPDHPLAPLASFPRIGARDLAALHRRLLAEGGAVVVLVGPVGPAERALVASALAFLHAPPADPAISPACPVPEALRLRLLEDPGARQIRVAVTWPVPPALGWAEAQAVADLLGGGATARLDRRLREELGLVYEARARLVREPGHALVRVETRCDAAHAVAVVDALRGEIQGMATLDEDALGRARATRLFAVARGLDGAEATAGTLADLAVLGLDPAQRQAELDTLAGLSLDEAARAAAVLLDPFAPSWRVLGADEPLFELQRRDPLGLDGQPGAGLDP